MIYLRGQLTNRGNQMTPSRLDLEITFVRSFLRKYARPSTIDDLLETLDECGTLGDDVGEDVGRIVSMLEGVRAAM